MLLGRIVTRGRVALGAGLFHFALSVCSAPGCVDGRYTDVPYGDNDERDTSNVGSGGADQTDASVPNGKTDATASQDPEPEPEPGDGKGDVGGSRGNTSAGAGGNAAAGSGGKADTGGAAGSSSEPILTPGSDTTITAFSRTHVYFAGADSKREVDKTVRFPGPELGYKKITLDFTLGCPDNRCDAWDRRGFLAVVNKNGSSRSFTELLRFMTPYGRGGHWSLDVTGLRPLLTGEVTLRSFIDTWVGPGHAAGNGWLVDAKFRFEGGMPNPRPLTVIRLWDETAIDYGNPDNPARRSVEVTLPAEAGKVELRSLITGHGQGNAENCAEFCQKTHGYKLGSKVFEKLIWRNDCATTAVPDQGGTWTLSRAGWCPGAIVHPWTTDVSSAVTAGSKLNVQYAVSAYENSCRPGVSSCTGCTLGTGCEYDGGNHTPPHYIMSALLIVYRR